VVISDLILFIPAPSPGPLASALSPSRHAHVPTPYRRPALGNAWRFSQRSPCDARHWRQRSLGPVSTCFAAPPMTTPFLLMTAPFLSCFLPFFILPSDSTSLRPCLRICSSLHMYPVSRSSCPPSSVVSRLMSLFLIFLYNVYGSLSCTAV
jgi:hypothetical protein